MLNALVSEYVRLRQELDAKQACLKELAAALAGAAVFPEGKGTAHIRSAGYDVTVQRRQNVKWDQ